MIDLVGIINTHCPKETEGKFDRGIYFQKSGDSRKTSAEPAVTSFLKKATPIIQKKCKNYQRSMAFNFISMLPDQHV